MSEWGTEQRMIELPDIEDVGVFIGEIEVLGALRTSSSCSAVFSATTLSDSGNSSGSFLTSICERNVAGGCFGTQTHLRRLEGAYKNESLGYKQL